MTIPCPICTEDVVYDPAFAGKTIYCSYCKRAVLILPVAQLSLEYQEKYRAEQEALRKKQEAQQRKLEEQARKERDTQEREKQQRLQKAIESAKQSEREHLPEPPPHRQPAGKALQDCPDCGASISRKADACPHCGCPMGRTAEKATDITKLKLAHGNPLETGFGMAVGSILAMLLFFVLMIFVCIGGLKSCAQSLS